MKKVLALLLAIMMVFALFACGGKTSSDADTGKEDTGAAGNDTAAGGDTAADAGEDAGEEGLSYLPGYYDDPVDHFARDEYEFTYCFTAASALTDSTMAAWERMGSKYNFKVSEMTSDRDGEAYVQGIEVAVNRGVDGLIIDCDPTIANRVYELLEELEIPYVCLYNNFFDENNNNLAPAVMLDNYDAGDKSVGWCADHAGEFWGDNIDSSKVGLLNLGWTTSPTFVLRCEGAADTFLANFPNGTVIEADGVTMGSLDTASGYDLTSQFMSANPNIEYWIIFGCLEAYAQGAARYVETLAPEVQEKIMICNSGSNLLPAEFASGYTGSWKVCYAVADIAYAGPAAVGLIALCDGRADQLTLWQEVRADGDIATKYVAPAVMVTIDNYADFKAEVEVLYYPDLQ